MSAKHPIIPNEFKLVLIILVFFLALTYVRAFETSGPSYVSVQGNAPTDFPIYVANSSNAPIYPQFMADGPFTLAYDGDPTQIQVGAFAEKTLAFSIVPSDEMRVGDVYTARVRVITGDQVQIIPFQLQKQAAAFSLSPTGFVSLGDIDVIKAIQGVLILFILVAGIALVFKVKNRM